MDIDTDEIDEAALTLLFLTLLFLTLDRDGRAWKGLDWEVTDRLHAKGLTDDPRGKAKSVRLTPEGRAEAERLFETLFARTT